MQRVLLSTCPMDFGEDFMIYNLSSEVCDEDDQIGKYQETGSLRLHARALRCRLRCRDPRSSRREATHQSTKTVLFGSMPQDHGDAK
jgi:hypothetical protein